MYRAMLRALVSLWNREMKLTVYKLTPALDYAIQQREPRGLLGFLKSSGQLGGVGLGDIGGRQRVRLIKDLLRPVMGLCSGYKGGKNSIFCHCHCISVVVTCGTFLSREEGFTS